jgi:hypothetical protein
MNRPEVQRAIHANVSGAVPGPWTPCNAALRYSRDDLLSSVLPVYHELLKEGAFFIKRGTALRPLVTLDGALRLP